MARGNHRTWAPVPRQLLSDEKFLGLPPSARELLFRLYLVADSEGRFGAGKRVLCGATLMHGGTIIALRRLEVAGYVELYEVDGVVVGEIVGWHDSVTGRMKAKFGAPEWPARQVANQPPKGDPNGPPKGAPKGAPRCPPRKRERKRSPPSGGGRVRARADKRARALEGVGDPPPSLHPPPDDSPTAPLCVAARQWLERRIRISAEAGNRFADYQRGVDIHGPQLRQLQLQPGFRECVETMLGKPDAKWGKKLTSGMSLLRALVDDWLPSDTGGEQKADSHFTAPLSLEEAERQHNLATQPV